MPIMRLNRMIGMRPFELVLSRTPSPLSFQQTPMLAPSASRAHFKFRFLAWLRGLMATADKNLLGGQDRYKNDFDKRIRLPTPEYQVGDQVLVDREAALRSEERTEKDRVNNKLAPADPLRTAKPERTAHPRPQGESEPNPHHPLCHCTPQTSFTSLLPTHLTIPTLPWISKTSQNLTDPTMAHGSSLSDLQRTRTTLSSMLTATRRSPTKNKNERPTCKPNTRLSARS